jgi:hypothetical protein
MFHHNNKNKMFQYNLTDFPEFQPENKSELITENHPKCIIDKKLKKQAEFDMKRYKDWRQVFYDDGYSDDDLLKMIHEKRLASEMTALEKTIPFFYINNSLDIHILREMYLEKNKNKIKTEN